MRVAEEWCSAVWLSERLHTHTHKTQQAAQMDTLPPAIVTFSSRSMYFIAATATGFVQSACSSSRVRVPTRSGMESVRYSSDGTSATSCRRASWEWHDTMYRSEAGAEATGMSSPATRTVNGQSGASAGPGAGAGCRGEMGGWALLYVWCCTALISSRLMGVKDQSWLVCWTEWREGQTGGGQAAAGSRVGAAVMRRCHTHLCHALYCKKHYAAAAERPKRVTHRLAPADGLAHTVVAYTTSARCQKREQSTAEKRTAPLVPDPTLRCGVGGKAAWGLLPPLLVSDLRTAAQS